MRMIFFLLFLGILILLSFSVSGAIEDFTTYTEVDAGGDIVVTSDTITVTSMIRNLESHVTYDYGVNHFGDLSHWIDFKFTGGIDRGMCIVWCVSDGSNTHTELQTGNDGMSLYGYFATGIYRIYMMAYDNGDVQDYFNAVINTQYYLWVNRSGTAFSCDIFDNVLRRTSDKLDTISVVSSSADYQYMVVSGSMESGVYPDTHISCIISNLDLREALEDKKPIFGGLYYPSNNSVDLCPCDIVFGVNVSDAEGNVIDITFLDNVSGHWVVFLFFDDVCNGSYYGVGQNFTKFNYTYYWRVNATNIYGTNSSEIFTFNTTSNINCSVGVSNEETIQEYFLLAICFSLIAFALAIRKNHNGETTINIIKKKIKKEK